MTTVNLVKSNRYQDLVTLMQVAVRLRALAGIEDASLMMGTGPNKEMLEEAQLLSNEGKKAGPNDLIVAMRGTKEATESVGAQIEDLLSAEIRSEAMPEQEAPHSLVAGLEALPEANLVLISTPGLYAAAEARKAILLGRHVMIFSDNVSIEDELALKTLARERGLLLMGPDCGTAIIGGVPLGFANAVRRGPIGVVGASGTGMQEVTSLIDRYGSGVSHAIGTGSRDLSERIGGVMTVAGMKALLADRGTEVVVVVSKPPHPGAAERILEAASVAAKPVVFCFLGMDPGTVSRYLGSGNARFSTAATLEDAARTAVVLSGFSAPVVQDSGGASLSEVVEQLQPSQKYIRGLFSGGTFCYEAMLILQTTLGPVYSNIPLSPDMQLTIQNPKLALERSEGSKIQNHVCLDLGADEFTVGRPHPMIDMTARAERILLEAEDPNVAVILLDVVLGYGAHPDPAGALAAAIKGAREHTGGRRLPVVASICGTASDPQMLEQQRRKLEEVGVILAESNAAAARLAARICEGHTLSEPTLGNAQRTEASSK